MRRSLKKIEAHRHTIRPSWRGLLPSLLIGPIVAGFAHQFLIREGFGYLSLPVAALGYNLSIALPLSGFLFAILVARPIFLMIDSVYIIGRHHLYVITGRISLRRKQTEIPYEDMRGVRCEQGIVDRILGIGAVIVWTATAESSAVALRGVYPPEKVTAELLHRIDRARLKRPRASPGQEQEIQYRAA